MAAAVARVGSGSGKARVASATTVGVSYTPTQPGNALVMAGTSYNSTSGGFVPTVADNLGAAHVVANQVCDGTNMNVFVAYQLNIPAGITTVTATIGATAVAYATVSVEELSDVGYVGPQVSTNSGGSAVTSLASGNITAPNGSIVIGVGGANDNSATAWNTTLGSWTQLIIESDSTAWVVAQTAFQASTGAAMSITWSYPPSTSPMGSNLVAFQPLGDVQVNRWPSNAILNSKGVPLRTSGGGYLLRTTSLPVDTGTSGSTLTSGGEAQGPSQAAGGAVDVTTGQAQGPSQAQGGAVVVDVGAAQGPSQAAGKVTEVAVGQTQTAAQAAGAVVELAAAAAQGPSQAGAAVTEVAVAQAQGPSQAQAAAVTVDAGAVQGPSQAQAGAISVDAGAAQAPSQAQGGVVEVVGGAGAGPSQGAGTGSTDSAITIIAAGESGSHAQTAGAAAAPDVAPTLPVFTSGGGHKKRDDEKRARRERAQQAESDLIYQSILQLLVALVASEVLDD